MSNVFLVTSVIWSGSRTFYTPEQRFEQTLETSKSIRRHCPDSFKILIEGSPSVPVEYIQVLQTYYDLVLLLPEELKTKVKDYNVSVGETTLLNYGIRAIVDLKLPGVKRIFKISGRNLLTEDFNANNYPDDKYGFGMHFQTEAQVTSRGFWDHADPKWGWTFTQFNPFDSQSYITVLFSIPYENALKFLSYIQSVRIDIEHDLFNNIPKDEIRILPVLGVSGNYGGNGVYYRR